MKSGFALTRSASFFLCASLLLALFCATLLPQPASATTVMVGGNPISTNFSCNNGVASGNLLQVSSCPDGPKDGKIISFFVCQFEQLLNEVLSKVYCAVVDDAVPAIQAALTLMVVLAGAMFLMGTLPFTAKELAVLGAKFSLVLAFATQAEYMIGIGYNLFVNMSKEGIVIVMDNLMTMSSLSGRTINNVDDVYALFDDTLNDFFSIASEGEKKANDCQNAIFVMLIAIGIAVPPIAMISVYFIVRFLWMMLRAVFGYCQGLLGLTFLTVLAPIYVSFALFKPTRTLFDKWVKYLISFGFQMVVVFAFLGMVFYILSQMADDLQSYSKLVKPYTQDVLKSPGVVNFADTCGICELQPTTDLKAPPECKAGGDVIALDEMSKDENFMRFMSVKLIAMIIILYVLDIMIGFVPEMAKMLAGPKYAGQLGGGSKRQGGNMFIPGEQAISGVLSTAGVEYMRSTDAASGTINAFTGALSKGILADGGLVDGMIRGAVNPNEPFRDPREFDNSPAGALFGAAAGLTVMGAGAKAIFGADADAPSASGGSDGAPPPNTGGRDGTPPPAAGGRDGADDPAVTSAMLKADRASIDADLSARARAGEVNLSVANQIVNAVSSLPKDASTDAIRTALHNATIGASRVEVTAIAMTLSTMLSDEVALELNALAARLS